MSVKSISVVSGFVLTIGLASPAPALAEDMPFSVERKGVCEYASDKSDTSRSLRSLYSCKHKIVIIRNTSDKIKIFDRVVLNQNKCRNHLFLDGEAEGPIKPDGAVVFATSCKLTRIDFRIDQAAYFHRF